MLMLCNSVRERAANAVNLATALSTTVPGAAVERVLVRVVPAVVVAVAEPVRLHANGGRLAGEVVGRAGDVAVPARALALVRRLVVLAVVDAVAHLALGDAAEVVAGELAVDALGVVAALLVSAVAAVVLVVAPPGGEDAPAVAAAELSRLAGVLRAVVGVLVGAVAVAAVGVAVAGPQPADALAVGAGELAR